MTDVYIRVYGTEELHSAYSMTPLNKAKIWIEAALNDTPLTPHVTAVSQFEIPAPQEAESGRFYASSPCGGAEQAWDHLANWWYDYVACKIGNSDCDVLITNSDSQAGRCVNDVAAVAEGGPQLPNLPDDTTKIFGYDDKGPYDSMQTVLHEVGHAFLHGGADGFNEHNVGKGIPGSDGYHRSPFYNADVAKRGGTNECGESLNEISYGKWALTYSDCCGSKMRD